MFWDSLEVLTVESQTQLAERIQTLPSGQAFRVNLDRDFSAFAATIREAITRGQIDAIFTIFNGRKDEYWRVTAKNIVAEGIGAPVAILSPDCRLEIGENGPQ